MKIVKLEEKQIRGLSIRTSNAKEMNPQTAKIGALHQQFDAEISVDYKNGARVYGVYYNYESDHTGDFSVLAGVDQIAGTRAENLESITLPAVTYMVFEATGEVPQIVIETWAKIWEYFSSENSQFQRSYITDFEFYKNRHEVEIYIGVKT